MEESLTNRLTQKIRTIIMLFSIGLAILVLVYLKLTIPGSDTLNLRISETYGVISIIFLYLTLLHSPLYSVFPIIPLKGIYHKARRSLGLSALLFSTIHGFVGFFLLLGGFEGLKFLSQRYLIAIILSTIALIILAILGASSFNRAISKIGRWWKRIHRLIYIAGFLVLIHILMLGSDLGNIDGTYSKIFITAVFILIALEIIRFEKYLSLKTQIIFFKAAPYLLFSVLTLLTYSLYTNTQVQNIFKVHPSHSSDSSTTAASTSIHGGTTHGGNARYNVQMNIAQKVEVNKDLDLTFSVTEADSGRKIPYFEYLNEKDGHLIITDSSLSYYKHVHPVFDGENFKATIQIPENKIYRVYLNFKPLMASEQIFAFAIVPDNFEPVVSTQFSDTVFTKVHKNYEFKLILPDNLNKEDLTAGKQKLQFEIKDTNTGKLTKDLKPYLGQWGHMSLINQSNYSMTHSHATDDISSAPDSVINFGVMPLYNNFEAGTYRVFTEFQINDEIVLTDYTIYIK